jgi:uncharacterized membrane protein
MRDWITLIIYSVMIAWGIMLITLYITSFNNPAGAYTVYTNNYHERLLETIMIIFGVVGLTIMAINKVVRMGMEARKPGIDKPK